MRFLRVHGASLASDQAVRDGSVAMHVVVLVPSIWVSITAVSFVPALHSCLNANLVVLSFCEVLFTLYEFGGRSF
jgi:hypothetical protein